MRLLLEARAAALKRPWLAAPIAIGTCLQILLGLFSPTSGIFLIATTLLGAATTVAVTAMFTELWRGDGRHVEAGAFLRTTGLLLMSYPMLLLFGMVSAPLTYFFLRSDNVGMVYLLVCAGKLIAFAATALSVLAVACRDESSGAFQAFGRGWKMMKAHAGFMASLLIGTYLIQEAIVYGTSLFWYTLFGSSLNFAVKILTGVLATTIPLAGCVALPLQAVKSGRLKP